jgi:hypothetical protein
MASGIVSFWLGSSGGMSIMRSVPGSLIWLFWLLVAIVLVCLVALLVHHLGGFGLTFHIGDFHFNLGVT